MTLTHSEKQSVSNTLAISNTGPLISVFQSDSFDLLADIFIEVWISTICCSELIDHGWRNAIESAGSKLVVVELADDEKQEALSVAAKIAEHPRTHDAVAENHLGEAQVIIVAQRDELRDAILLLDELAARAVAREYDVNLSGFPGVLLLAVQNELISAEELKVRLEACREQGTHYSVSFIQQVYEMAKQSQR